MNKASSERRDTERRNVNLQVGYPDREGYPVDTTESVSPSGILVRSDQYHRVDEEVYLSISLPGFPDNVQVKAQVTRIREATATTPRGVAFQIKKEDFAGELAKILTPAKSREFSLSSGPYSVLASLPRVRLARTPTPLHRADALTKALGGPEIWFKRDDLTDFAKGGNQVRKIEMVAADAIQKNVHTLVLGCKSLHSDRIRITAATAAKLGMKTEIIYCSPNIPKDTGHCDFFGITPLPLIDSALDIDANIDLRVKQLQAQGISAYGMTEHETGWLGACGYLLASIEISSQCKGLGLVPDVLVCPVASGETMSGLVAGQRWLDCSYDVLGISVSQSESWCAQRVATIVYDVCSQLQIADTIPVDDIWVHGDHIGQGGYGHPSAEAAAATKLVASLEGIYLDPIISGKAMAGLITAIETGNYKKHQSIIFLHTGGWG